MGLFVRRDHWIFSLCLPSSAHLSASLFQGSQPRWAFILMKTVIRACSIRSRRSCRDVTSGFPHMEGNFPSPIHFWEEDRKHAESDRRITGVLSFFLLASSSASYTAPSSSLLEKLSSYPLPSWQHFPLFSCNQ